MNLHLIDIIILLVIGLLMAVAIIKSAQRTRTGCCGSFEGCQSNCRGCVKNDKKTCKCKDELLDLPAKQIKECKCDDGKNRIKECKCDDGSK